MSQTILQVVVLVVAGGLVACGQSAEEKNADALAEYAREQAEKPAETPKTIEYKIEPTWLQKRSMGQRATAEEIAERVRRENELAVTPIRKDDPSIPFSSYRELSTHAELAALHFAMTGNEIVYDDMAEAISEEYARTSDRFRQRELLDSLKPEIEKLIADYRSRPAFYMDEPLKLEHYDFESKQFPVHKESQLSPRESFSFRGKPIPGYSVFFSNIHTVTHFDVPDQETAKTLERLVSRFGSLSMRIYAQVVGVQPSTPLSTVARVMKVEVRGTDGRVFAEFSPPAL